jgi:hypothetical protein
MYFDEIRNRMTRLLKIGVPLSLVFLAVYQYSGQNGIDARYSCIMAMAAAVVSGIAGLWPTMAMAGQEPEKIILGVFWVGAIRLLIGLPLVAIILLMMSVSRSWFLGCYGVFYAAFIAVDTWLIVNLLQGRILKKDKM